MRRSLLCIAIALAVSGFAGCHKKKVNNPLANVGSKQPDKVLFDRAMDLMKKNRWDQARLVLQTLINTYPDSEFLARAKLAIGDSWYAQGTTTALTQAEAEYKDFITFFPNMPEAAEAQMKIANIHYQQMEKPDRDFTHAKRAEEEYRQMVLQYPDSKLLPEAKQRLRDVQEVLGEREFRIGYFYYMREAWPAAIARLKSVVDTYPLYSGADEALFLLGDSNERQADRVRQNKLLKDDFRERLVSDFQQHAIEAYSRILTRYPVMQRADDARKRLQGLHQPIPTATPEAIAQNKAEEESRGKLGLMGRTMLNFHKRPDVTESAKVGEPTLVDPRQTNAVDILRRVDAVLLGKDKTEGEHQVSVETVGTGTPDANQPVPRSETGPNSVPELTPNAAPPDSSVPKPAPPQVNDLAAPDSGSHPAQSDTAQAPASAGNDPQQGESSSSKDKKKKGLRKIVPF